MKPSDPSHHRVAARAVHERVEPGRSASGAEPAFGPASGAVGLRALVLVGWTPNLTALSRLDDPVRS
jgi:hypothetical protein